MAIHEECGIVGIFDPKGDCARTTYYGLYALQHRGQEACGIATIQERELSCHKDLGLVGDVFDQDLLDRLNGTMAVGHVRYAPSRGTGRRENAQPLALNYVKGTLAVAHNGSLVNMGTLKTEFENNGAIFQTNSDAEMIAYAIAQERLRCESVEEAVRRAVARLRGAFSLVIMSPRKLVAVRDPWGFRPLCMGRRGDAILFASESCALDAVDAVFERDLEPGEIVVVEDGQVRSLWDARGVPSSLCIFEYIYFARPDSIICGQSVHETRLEAGRILAREYPVKADVVVGVPDSGLDAAMGYAQESGIPYGEGFVKNRYVGRTFITPDQKSRENAVRIKLGALRSQVAGKRVVMIDDSIVRGTTSKQIINLLRDAGATEVHFLVSSPPFIAPCFFGTDIPDKKVLIACQYTVEEIQEKTGADSLGFLSTEALAHIAPHATCGFCTGCFTEEYPVDTVDR